MNPLKILQQIRNSYRLRKLLNSDNTLSIGNPVQVHWGRIDLAGGNTLEIGRQVICHGTLSCQKEGASCHLGENTFVGARSILVATEDVFVGDDVLIAHDCYIIDSDGHSLDPEIRKQDIPNRWKNYKDWSVVASAPIRIEDSAWIGPGVTILKGVTIGKGAIVSAGSVVTRSVPPLTMAAGVPAKTIRNLSK